MTINAKVDQLGREALTSNTPKADLDQLGREASNAMMASRHFSWMILSSFANIVHSLANCAPVAPRFPLQVKRA